jgi:hypothetical protein
MKKILLLWLCVLCVSCSTNRDNSDENANGQMAYQNASAEELYQLGNRYSQGTGVEKNYATAVEYYRRAAEMGNSNAQDKLGVRYLLGQGVPQDYAIARSWF